jgi:hypothetical protein
MNTRRDPVGGMGVHAESLGDSTGKVEHPTFV